MKVLHYKTNFLNPSETFIDRLIRNHNRFEPVAMCVHKMEFADHLPVYESPKSGLMGLLNFLSFHLDLSLPLYADTIDEVRPDIVHAHFGFDGYRLCRITSRKKVPLVVGFYGSDVSRLPTEFRWKYRYGVLARKAQAFIAATKLMKSQLVDLGFPEERIEVIRFGVGLEEFSYRNGYKPTNRLVMVGRMVEKKGFEYALRAVEILKNRGRSVTIDLLGDGPLRTDLEQLAERLGISDRVRFNGYVSNRQVEEQLKEHSILLAPSVTAADGDKEGLPNTILEAMACGVPVIASNHAAIPEVIIDGKTGLLVPERQPEAIASAVESVLDGKFDVETARIEARKLVKEFYAVEQMVKDTENLYNKVLDRYEKETG